MGEPVCLEIRTSKILILKSNFLFIALTVLNHFDFWDIWKSLIKFGLVGNSWPGGISNWKLFLKKEELESSKQ